MIDIDAEYPIKLANIESIINRIYQQYPMINKTDVALIVKALFEEMRYSLLQYEKIKINGLTTLQIHPYSKRSKTGKETWAFTVRTHTPKKFNE